MNKTDISEEARLIAILRGNYLAKWFPSIWRAQQEKKQDNLKQQLEQKFRK